MPKQDSVVLAQTDRAEGAKERVLAEHLGSVEMPDPSGSPSADYCIMRPATKEDWPESKWVQVGPYVGDDPWEAAWKEMCHPEQHLSRAQREMGLVELGLRKRIHNLEQHNQMFERCESAWCNPEPANDPSREKAGDHFRNAASKLPLPSQKEAEPMHVKKSKCGTCGGDIWFLEDDQRWRHVMGQYHNHNAHPALPDQKREGEGATFASVRAEFSAYKKEVHSRGIGGKDLDCWLVEQLVDARNKLAPSLAPGIREGGGAEEPTDERVQEILNSLKVLDRYQRCTECRVDRLHELITKFVGMSAPLADGVEGRGAKEPSISYYQMCALSRMFDSHAFSEIRSLPDENAINEWLKFHIGMRITGSEVAR